jgi:hypothetical protein
MRRRNDLLGILPLTAALLAGLACGGGGGGGGVPTITIAFDHPLTARYFHNQHAGLNAPNNVALTVSATGTVDPVPSGVIYVVLEVDQAVFTGAPGVDTRGTNGFILYLTPDVALAPGTYTGQIRVRIYQDAAATQPYQVVGGTLPYTLTVDPELTVTARVDGVPVGQVFSSSSTAVTMIWGQTIYWYPLTPAAAMTLHPGQLLELEASLPVTWYSPDQFYPYGSLWDAPVVTATTLSQTMLPHSQSGMTGSAWIAMPVSGPQYGAGLVIDVLP